MGVRDLIDPPVEVGAVFERFPASVRGAIVVRGTDPDPHQVSLAEAAVVEVVGRRVRDLPLEAVTVELAPRGQVLIPFDIPFAGLDPGWYRVDAEALVDGQRRVRGPGPEGERFVVPWPGRSVRRGEIPVARRIRVPRSGGAVIERLECRGDSTTVRWREAPGPEPEFHALRVILDGRLLPEVDWSRDPDTGHRATVVYPLPKDGRSLRFEVERRDGKKRSWAADMDLP